MIFFFLGEIFPSLSVNVTFRLWDTLILLNSVVNPIIYCYRISRFRNAVLEMLRMGKSQATQPAVGTVLGTHVRRNNLFAAEEDVQELQNVSISAPSLDRGTRLLVGLQPQQSSSILIATATINFESAGSNARLVNDFKSQGKVNRIHNVYRSKSFDSSISKHLANSCPKVEDRIFQIRPKSAPSFGSANPIILDEASTDSGFNTNL